MTRITGELRIRGGLRFGAPVTPSSPSNTPSVAAGTSLTYELFYAVNNSGDTSRVNDNTKSFIILMEIAA